MISPQDWKGVAGDLLDALNSVVEAYEGSVELRDIMTGDEYAAYEEAVREFHVAREAE